MLYLVGIGLEEKDISLKALEICERCDLYADRYTSFVDDERIAFISKSVGKPVKALDRSGMEERVSDILKEAQGKDVAILVGGDPLVATTHKIIFIEAKKADVQVEVCHSASALSALMGESGLDFYRFGQICTISKWVKHYSPVSFYEAIQKNRGNDLHSIVLLDYDPARHSSLEVKEAIRILEEAEAKYNGGIISDDALIFVMHKVALEGQQKVLTTIKEAKRLSFGNGPTAILIPAKITEIEREVLGSMY